MFKLKTKQKYFVIELRTALCDLYIYSAIKIMHVALYLNKNLKHVFEQLTLLIHLHCDSVFINNNNHGFIGINPSL